MKIETVPFGLTSPPENSNLQPQQVELFRCTNSNGMSIELINYGAIVTSVSAPDRSGNFQNVTLSHSDLPSYENCPAHFGATIGRFGNRIAGGKFSLDGTDYHLATNNGPNHLHGGDFPFDSYVWQASTIEAAEGDAVGVEFRRLSPDGEEGYPGNLQVTARYILTEANELIVELEGITDAPTVVNLTNHNYWNLGGAGAGKVLDHIVKIESDQFLAVDETIIPTGVLSSVEGTPLDLRQPTPIGEKLVDIDADPKGYDHCYVLSNEGAMRLAATVIDPASGRKMEIETTQPGIQFYTGNFLDGGPGCSGFGQYEAFCLETQHYPDSPNQDSFPSTVLRPDETYREVTIHRFSTVE